MFEELDYSGEYVAALDGQTAGSWTLVTLGLLVASVWLMALAIWWEH